MQPTNYQTPKTLYYQPEKKQVSATGKALADCAKFTVEAAELFSPKHSFLLHGIEAMGSRGDFSHIDHGIGFLMILSSPAILGLKCLLGIPALLGGAISTAVIAPIHASEKLVNAVAGPSEATVKRKEHTEQFVARMKEILKSFKTVERIELEKHPERLISLALLTVAFLSRTLHGDQLKAVHEIISPDDVIKMDDQAKEYFSKVCLMKSCLQDLNLSPDDGHAWQILTQYIKDLYSETNQLQNSEKNALKLLDDLSNDLSQKISKDEIFKAAWQKS